MNPELKIYGNKMKGMKRALGKGNVSQKNTECGWISVHLQENWKPA